MPLVHTAEEAAVIIGGNCKASWLREKARLREIPFAMIGGSYSFTDAHIDGILQMFEQRPAPKAPRAQARKAVPADIPAAVPLLQARIPRRRRTAEVSAA